MATVLLIDDEEDSADSYAMMFRREGHTSIVAYNGKEGLERLAEAPEKPDVIFCDMRMPVMNGEEFLQRLKETPHAGIPVVAIGSFPIDTVGLAGRLQKPIRYNQLRDIAVQYAQNNK